MFLAAYLISKVTNPISTGIQIDLPAADPARVAAQIEAMFGIDTSQILNVSAKTGAGVEEVLKAIVTQIPPPVGDMSEQAPLKALLFDSSYVCLGSVCSLAELTRTDMTDIGV